MKDASDKQVRFALDLLKNVGVYPDELVTHQMARRYKLPMGDTVRESVKSMTMAKCAELISGLLGEK